MNLHPDYLLNQIQGPADVKKLSVDQLHQVADEIRHLVVEKDAAIGGHLGPNLGIVETTLAFHYVFDSPHDKIVWDISHQSYPHKMLTGRAYGFLDNERYHDVTPYSNQDESPHDYYRVGHTSTSIALAVGMAKARDLTKQSGDIVAVIGDGSLSGGMALEGLNNAGKYDGNLIIIFNDNQMSIDDVNGGMFDQLTALRESNGEAPNNLFKAMGLDYKYIADGNDVETMIHALEEVKGIDHPIVLHVNTVKGLGYAPALADEEAWHWHSPFKIEDGSDVAPASDAENYDQIIKDELGRQIEAGQPLMVITAAVPGVFGLGEIKAKYPAHYDDVDIAEQYSVTYATGLAENGARPVLFQNSTFFQRAYDQVIHDMALNRYPVVTIVKNGRISDDSSTHQSDFDLAMLSNVPNIEYLAPTNAEELVAMLQWALTQTEKPVIIREPAGTVTHGTVSATAFNQIKAQVVHQGKDVAIIGLGDFFALGQAAAAELAKDGIDATLINPVSASTLDEATLGQLVNDHQVVVTLENASMSGGFGEHVDRFFAPTKVRVLNFGAAKEFNDVVPLAKLYDRYHLTPTQIATDVKAVLKNL